MPGRMQLGEAMLWLRGRLEHDAIVTNGAFRRGQSVMIQGASSGVGLMGLQIARYLGASTVIGTSTNPDRRARLFEFGADHAIATTNPDWPDVVRFGWYVLDAGSVQVIRDVRDEFIRGPLGDRPNPASTLVQVAALFRPGLLVEVDAVVAVPSL